VPTIGVSLAVPEPWGSRLQEFRVSNGDSQGATIPAHITLVPPTEVDQHLMGAVERHLAAVAAGGTAYRVHLRGSGTFRPVSPVVFVNLVEGISMTEQLANACRREPLARHLDRAFEELSDFECSFTVTAFHLYVHDPDLGWKATRDFALTGAG
jgi:2'-5' RNA ligase